MATFWFCAQGRSEIGMGDKNTGKVKVWKVPTDKSVPTATRH